MPHPWGRNFTMHKVNTTKMERTSEPTRTMRWMALFVILVFTAGCDQAAKHFARTELSQRASTTFPCRFLEFSLAENPGAFLSLGASLPQVVRSAILTFGVSIGLALLLVYLLRTPRLRWPAFLGWSLIWAGGLSNLVDRFARGGLVTDFLVLRAGSFHTGVFNLADLAVVVGLLLLIASWRAWPSHAEVASAEKPTSGETH